MYAKDVIYNIDYAKDNNENEYNDSFIKDGNSVRLKEFYDRFEINLITNPKNINSYSKFKNFEFFEMLKKNDNDALSQIPPIIMH